jgi:LysM repeat protein
MLKMQIPKYYQVKKGQTIERIAERFSLPPSLLVKENGLKQQVYAGQILRIPTQRGNAFTAHEQATKALCCGDDKRYEEKNGTDILYPGMRVIL